MNRLLIMFSRKNEQGSTLMLLAVCLAGFAFAATARQFVVLAHAQTCRHQTTVAQADNVARAGMVDAMNWFNRHRAQLMNSDPSNPDLVFQPLQPETISEQTGIAKEYFMSSEAQVSTATSIGQLCAHYEVRRQAREDAFDPAAAHDITNQRLDGHKAGEGIVWSIQSIGYVFRRRDAAVAYNVAPNEVVARSRVATEIRRLSLLIPSSGLTVMNQGTVALLNNSRVVGGLGFLTAGAPNVDATSGVDSQLAQDPAIVHIDPWNVFSATQDDLKSLADFSVPTITGDGTGAFASGYPSSAMVFVGGPAHFTTQLPLTGSGLLYVDGDLMIDAGTNSLFSGVIYVTGNVVINGPAHISGTLIASQRTGGTVTLNGVSDQVAVQFDATVIGEMQQLMGQYRENRAATYLTSSLK